MANDGIFIGWGETVKGRERKAEMVFGEEERRLAYVALSRAREELCISYVTDADGQSVAKGLGGGGGSRQYAAAHHGHDAPPPFAQTRALPWTSMAPGRAEALDIVIFVGNSDD